MPFHAETTFSECEENDLVKLRAALKLASNKHTSIEEEKALMHCEPQIEAVKPYVWQPSPATEVSHLNPIIMGESNTAQSWLSKAIRTSDVYYKIVSATGYNDLLSFGRDFRFSGTTDLVAIPKSVPVSSTNIRENMLLFFN